jgi:hypothetical protein
MHPGRLSLFVERKQLDNTELLTKLQNELSNAIASHYAGLTREFDDVCGYAVCAPATFEHVFPAYQLKSELRDRPADSLGLATYFPPEWNSFGTVFFTDELNSLVTEISNRFWGDESLEPKVVYEVILKAMVDLERDGVFGPRSDDRFLSIWDIGGDESMIISTSEELNSETVHSRVLAAFGRVI